MVKVQAIVTCELYGYLYTKGETYTLDYANASEYVRLGFMKRIG